MTNDLQQFIYKSREAGKTNEEIRQELLSTGWGEEKIKEVLLHDNISKRSSMLMFIYPSRKKVIAACLLGPLMFLVTGIIIFMSSFSPDSYSNYTAPNELPYLFILPLKLFVLLGDLVAMIYPTDSLLFAFTFFLIFQICLAYIWIAIIVAIWNFLKVK